MLDSVRKEFAKERQSEEFKRGLDELFLQLCLLLPGWQIRKSVTEDESGVICEFRKPSGDMFSCKISATHIRGIIAAKRLAAIKSVEWKEKMSRIMVGNEDNE